MFKKKLIAMGLVVSMLGSLVACGGEEEPKTATQSNAAPTSAVKPAGEAQSQADSHEGISSDCIVSFEDDSLAFATINESDWTGDKDSEMSIASVFGSKVLRVTRPNKGTPAVAIDLLSLLGENASLCTKITVDIGVDCGADFASSAGTVSVFAGESGTECSTSWSLYRSDAAMKTFTIDLGSNVLTSGSANYLAITSMEDAAKSPLPIVIDNIICYDAGGNALPVDTSVEFAVEGVGEYDWSNGCKQPTDEVLLFAGVEADNGWWPDNANAFSFVENDTVNFVDPNTVSFTEGMVLTIYYSTVDSATITDAPYSAYPYLRMQNWVNYDEEGNEIADDGSGWYNSAFIVDVSYGADSATKSVEGFVEFSADEDGTPADDFPINDSYTIVQYSYEYIASALEAKGCTVDNWTECADFIGIADRGYGLKISAVTLGKAAE